MRKKSLSTTKDPFNNYATRNMRNTDLQDYNCGGFALDTYTWVVPFYRDEDDDCTYYAGWSVDELLNFKNFYREYTDSRREMIAERMFQDQLPIEEIRHTILELDAKYLLHTYPFLRRVNLNGISPKNRVIAYRLYLNYSVEYKYLSGSDFHFRVRQDGQWYEKIGHSEVRKCKLSMNHPWQSTSELIYDGEIIYFFDTRRKKRATTIVSRFGNYRIQ